MSDEPKPEQFAAAPPPDSNASTGLPDELQRERTRTRLASADALRAEHEVAQQRARLAELSAQLRSEQRRHEGIMGLRSVRLALGVSGRLRAVVVALERVSGGRVKAAGRAPQGLAGTSRRPHARIASGPHEDPRALPERYRAALLAALLDRSGPDARLRVTIIGRDSKGESKAERAGGSESADETELLFLKALATLGYDVTVMPAAGLIESVDPVPDVIVVADESGDPIGLPSAAIRVGVSRPSSPVAEIRGPWDVVISPGDDPGQAFVEGVERWLRATRVVIRVPAGSEETAASWGDTYVARDLRAAFRRAGWPARIQFYRTWDDPAVGYADVVVDLLGLYEAKTRPGSCRVLWQISHPELASPELYESYDLVFVASDSFARQMAERVSVPVRPLHQAADPERFRADPTGPHHELLFVANWRAGRLILEDLVPTDRLLAVYGRGWTPERLDAAYLAGESVDNDALGGYYASASIVLNDHWAGMRREGFISNRLYDASAAGAFVISDDVDGLDDEFDGGVLAYRDRKHLRQLVDQFLADPEARTTAAGRARRAVLERHTFAHRAAQLIEAVEPLLNRPPTEDGAP